MTEPEVISLMSQAINFRDWETKVAQVAASNNGRLPDFWMRAIYLSGLQSDLMHQWSRAQMTVRIEGPNRFQVPAENTSTPLRAL